MSKSEKEKLYWVNEILYAIEGLKETVIGLEFKIERSEKECSDFLLSIENVHSHLASLKVGLDELLEEFKSIESIKLDVSQIEEMTKRVMES